MEAIAESTVRPPSLLDLATPPGAPADQTRQWTGRGQNFAVAWTHAGSAGATSRVASPDETMVIVLDAGVTITGAGKSTEAAPRTVCILPPGDWQLQLRAGATCAVLSSLRENATADALNESAYVPPDPRISPVGVPWKPLRAGDEIRVFPIDSVSASKDKPRLKMLQTSTLSINWVEYDGPRDRSALSPHQHSSYEQGSLALIGNFVHHLRVHWGVDANAWQDDRHARLGSPSLMVVPVRTIHTSEGVGEGHHLLIDVFSPPRTDFIANGWVANSGDYEAPAKAPE